MNSERFLNHDSAFQKSFPHFREQNKKIGEKSKKIAVSVLKFLNNVIY